MQMDCHGAEQEAVPIEACVHEAMYSTDMSNKEFARKYSTINIFISLYPYFTAAASFCIFSIANNVLGASSLSM